MSDDEDIEFLLDQWTQSGTFTISRSELYHPGASEPTGTPVVEVSSVEIFRHYTDASITHWLREFVDNAAVLGYNFALYAQRQLLNSIMSTVVERIEVDEDVSGFALVLEYSVDEEASDIAKISYQIVECRERVEFLSEEEASEIGEMAGRFVTGVDTDIMFESTIYSQEREQVGNELLNMVNQQLG